MVEWELDSLKRVSSFNAVGKVFGSVEQDESARLTLQSPTQQIQRYVVYKSLIISIIARGRAYICYLTTLRQAISWVDLGVVIICTRLIRDYSRKKICSYRVATKRQWFHVVFQGNYKLISLYDVIAFHGGTRIRSFIRSYLFWYTGKSLSCGEAECTYMVITPTPKTIKSERCGVRVKVR